MSAARTPLAQGPGLAGSLLRREANALALMAGNLGSAFQSAVDCLAGARGRVVVAGSGKGGCAGRNTASLLLAVGLPSYFLSPDNAERADLGMLRSGDVVLAFSESGDTPGLSSLIVYARRHGMPVVGVTAQADSPLGRHARCLLLLPPVADNVRSPDAFVGTSTLQTALGEALALGVAQRTGRSADMFSGPASDEAYWSGRLLCLREVMRTGEDVPLVSAPTPMPEVLALMSRKETSVVGVVVKGRLAGVISDEYLRRRLSQGKSPGAVARNAMRPVPCEAEEGTLVAVALRQMQEKKVSALFVTRAGRPVGFVNVYDCLRAGEE